jgi:hypothetical protein
MLVTDAAATALTETPRDIAHLDRPQARRAASRSRMNSPPRPPPAPGGAAGRRPSTAVTAVGA